LRFAEEPMTMRELATRLSTDRPYTTLIVDDLEAREMVYPHRSPDGRRAKIVALTPHRARHRTTRRAIVESAPPPWAS